MQLNTQEYGVAMILYKVEQIALHIEKNLQKTDAERRLFQKRQCREASLFVR